MRMQLNHSLHPHNPKKLKVIGHMGKAMARSIGKANLSANVLELLTS